jgi:excisionase family DNA binding protein
MNSLFHFEIYIDTIPVIGYNKFMANIYSVKEAAERLGLDPSQVRRLLKSGDIKGKKLGHDWVVLSLDYKRKRRPKGYRNLAT